MTDTLQRRLSLAFLILLVLWGGYSLLSYLGVELHALVLVNETTVGQLRQLCPGGGLLCRGAWTVLPTVAHMLTRLAPFVWFILWSALLYGGFLFVRALRTERFAFDVTLRPWHVPLLFLGCTWLMFEVLSFTAGTPSNPMRIMYEPLPQVYVEATQEELDVLMENKNELLERGCLSIGSKTPHGATIYRFREWCVQAAFITRVIPPFLALLVLLMECALLGSLALRLLKIELPRISDHAMVSVVAGCGIWMMALWTLAQLSLYTAAAGWALVLLVPALCYKEVRFWWRVVTQATAQVEEPWYGGRVMLWWMLLALLALNFLTVVRPFPIGWDDLGRYLNQPRLLVSYGTAIPTMGTFQWEYLTSLGYLLFGYDSTFGATLGMQINWLAGLLAVLAAYVITRAVLGRGAGALAALLYYLTPVVGHFSFADMKTENAIFTVSVMALFCALLGVYPGLREDTEGEDDGYDWRLIALAGALAGVAFGMKATGIMMAMTIGVIIAGALLSPLAIAGGAGVMVIVYVMQGALNVAKISQKVYGSPDVLSKGMTLFPALLIAAACLGTAAYLRPEHLRRTFTAVGVFAAGFLLCVLPWMTVNTWKAGGFLPGLRFAPPNTLTTSFSISGEQPQDVGQRIRTLPKELQVNPQHAACISTSGAEELDRYWGYGSGWSHYLTLPWRGVLDLDSGGYYVTELPGFLLLPLLFLLPALWAWRGRGMRVVGWATVLLVAQWILLANGVPWYGIAMFLGLCVSLEAFVRWSPTRSSHYVAWILVGASVLTGFSMRLWQFEQQKSLLEYSMGKVSAHVLQKRTVNHYDLVRDTILERSAKYPESPYAYRMGTFIPYFVPKNLEHLPLADNQLDMFNCINQERDHALTLRRLQALGFNSLIFDTNTATIEKNPEGTLHQKVNALLDFLNDQTLGIQPIINDPAAGIAFVLLPVL